ncbi:MAG TPA: YSC84-related protein [Arenimonas sp.]|nr:YSC84-related protein [Arenimonas sp.]
MAITRKLRAFAWVAAVLGLFLLASGAIAKNPEKEKRKLREQSQDVLTALYEAVPGARAAVTDAAGYATFRNFGLKLGVAGGGRGKGLAVARGGAETFMDFLEVQAGVGVGIKKYDLVFVFETDEAYRRFIDSGWEYGGQATVAAKRGDQGHAFEGAVSVSPGVWLYQLTSSGLTAELTLKSSKYYKDKDLN